MSLGVAIGYNPGLQSLSGINDADLSTSGWLSFDEPINGSRKADAKCLKLPRALKRLPFELSAQAISKSPQGGYLRPLSSAEGFRSDLSLKNLLATSWRPLSTLPG